MQTSLTTTATPDAAGAGHTVTVQHTQHRRATPTAGGKPPG